MLSSFLYSFFSFSYIFFYCPGYLERQLGADCLFIRIGSLSLWFLLSAWPTLNISSYTADLPVLLWTQSLYSIEVVVSIFIHLIIIPLELISLTSSTVKYRIARNAGEYSHGKFYPKNNRMFLIKILKIYSGLGVPKDSFCRAKWQVSVYLRLLAIR